jgi:CMP-N-acetylneuraminic acid synthetase
MSRVIAVVPLKERSQRFPGKNLAILNQEPLYVSILRSLSLVDEIDEIYIFSSSTKFKVPIHGKTNKIFHKTRPTDLDGDDISINEVLRVFLNDTEAETIVLAHATSPFISPETISVCINKVVSGSHDSALAAVKLHKFIIFRGKALNFNRDQDLPPLQTIEPIVIEQGGLYVFRKSEFLARNSRVGLNPHFAYVNLFESIDIDTEEDFDLAKAMIQTKSVGS